MSPIDQVPAAGIAKTLVDADDLLVGKHRWDQLAQIKAIVGRCRYEGCGGDLQAIEAGEHDAQGEDGEITWYEARCCRCGREVASPNGRVLRRSSAHRETPRGWLDARESRDNAERKASRANH